jgi:hypothetical protein
MLLILFCFLICFNYVYCHTPPTRIEFEYINNRLNGIIVKKSLIPKYSPFTLEYCRHFRCKNINDSYEKETFCCFDKRKSKTDDFIAFYTGSKGEFYIRNTDMDYDTIIELLDCLELEFISPKQK